MSPWADETQGNIDSILMYSRIEFSKLEIKLSIILQLLEEIPSSTLVNVSAVMEDLGIPGEFGQLGMLLGDDKIYNIIVTTCAIVIVFFIEIPI